MKLHTDIWWLTMLFFGSFFALCYFLKSFYQAAEESIPMSGENNWLLELVSLYLDSMILLFSAIRQLPATLSTVPGMQIILVIFALVIWVGGGNILVYYHCKRRRKHWDWRPKRIEAKKLVALFKDFNKKEWLILITLIFAFLSLGAAALSYNK